jgi:DNA segregation ATPase FtsK/SpoIIIE-like protein
MTNILTKARASPLQHLKRRKPAQAPKGGLVIGYEKRGKAEEIYYLGDDVHSLTIGATRSGKSRCIVLQSIAYTALAGESIRRRTRQLPIRGSD